MLEKACSGTSAWFGQRYKYTYFSFCCAKLFSLDCAPFSEFSMRASILTQALLVSLCFASDLLRPYPLPDASLTTTSILNHSSYVNSFDESQWYLDNIPFVDFPDKSIQDVYYYRTSVIKRHLKYIHQGYGWIFTEFIHPVAWGKDEFLSDPPYVLFCVYLFQRVLTVLN